MEVVEGFLDTHIHMFVTYTSVEAVENFLDIHIDLFVMYMFSCSF